MQEYIRYICDRGGTRIQFKGEIGNSPYFFAFYKNKAGKDLFGVVRSGGGSFRPIELIDDDYGSADSVVSKWDGERLEKLASRLNEVYEEVGTLNSDTSLYENERSYTEFEAEGEREERAFNRAAYLMNDVIRNIWMPSQRSARGAGGPQESSSSQNSSPSVRVERENDYPSASDEELSSNTPSPPPSPSSVHFPLPPGESTSQLRKSTHHCVADNPSASGLTSHILRPRPLKRGDEKRAPDAGSSTFHAQMPSRRALPKESNEDSPLSDERAESPLTNTESFIPISDPPDASRVPQECVYLELEDKILELRETIEKIDDREYLPGKDSARETFLEQLEALYEEQIKLLLELAKEQKGASPVDQPYRGEEADPVIRALNVVVSDTKFSPYPIAKEDPTDIQSLKAFFQYFRACQECKQSYLIFLLNSFKMNYEFLAYLRNLDLNAVESKNLTQLAEAIEEDLRLLLSQ